MGTIDKLKQTRRKKEKKRRQRRRRETRRKKTNKQTPSVTFGSTANSLIYVSLEFQQERRERKKHKCI